MSLYNSLFGMNPATPILMAALGLDNQSPENWSERFESICDNWGEPDLYSEEGQKLLKEAKEMKFYPTGRFRDIYFVNEEGSDPKIVLYTRNGGGNRDFYEYVFELLSTHPNYIQDYDDDFDSTYAYIEFKAPENVIKFFEGTQNGKLKNVGEKFKDEIEAIQNGKTPPKEVMELVNNIVESFK